MIANTKRLRANIATFAGVCAIVLLVGVLRSPGRFKSTSTSYEPIVLFCSRTFKDEAKYKEVWTAFSTYTQAGCPGCKAMFSFIDQTKPNTALQFFWFDSLAAFAGQPKDKPELSSALWAEYAGTAETDTCQVFGGWNEQLKAGASQIPGVHYVFQKPNGFLRNDGSPPEALDGTPMIWISNREIKPGRYDAFVTAYKRACAAQFRQAPGFIGAMNFPSEKDPLTLWDLHVFTDWELGFVAHSAPDVVPIILGEEAPNMVGWDFPYGLAFVAKEDYEKMLTANPYNKVYRPYYWEDIIGPMPDFAK